MTYYSTRTDMQNKSTEQATGSLEITKTRNRDILHSN